MVGTRRRMGRQVCRRNKRPHCKPGVARNSDPYVAGYKGHCAAGYDAITSRAGGRRSNSNCQRARHPARCHQLPLDDLVSSGCKITYCSTNTSTDADFCNFVIITPFRFQRRNAARPSRNQRIADCLVRVAEMPSTRGQCPHPRKPAKIEDEGKANFNHGWTRSVYLIQIAGK
jgi:hypothetical protein